MLRFSPFCHGHGKRRVSILPLFVVCLCDASLNSFLAWRTECLCPLSSGASVSDVRRHMRRPGKIHFFVLATPASSWRAKNLMQAWEWVLSHDAVSGVTFLSLNEGDLTSRYTSIQLPEKYKIRPSLLMPRVKEMNRPEIPIKLVYSMEYCVHNTSADWCYRALDDTYINREGFEDVVAALAKVPDPRTTPLVYGNCVTNPRYLDHWFLQGGSGYLFSRKAAQIFSDYGREWLLSLPGTQDDFELTDFLVSKLNVTDLDAESGHFTGHSMDQSLFHRFDWNNHNHAPPCPDKLRHEDTCNHRLYPYRKVAFVHSFPYYTRPSEWDKWFKNMPDDAMWYNDGWNFCQCRARPGQMGKTLIGEM